MRILAIDYGDKNIGIAVSDELLITCSPIEVIKRENENVFKKPIKRIGELIKEFDVNIVVLGYPKNMDNSEGERCLKTQDFRNRLERNFKKVSVVLWDERLSSVSSKKVLNIMNVKNSKVYIDKIAATYILQSYLDYIN